MSSEPSLKDIYECSVCGYHYDPSAGDPEHGIQQGTPFSGLLDDWVCPLCGAGRDLFARLENKPVQSGENNQEFVRQYRNQDIVVHWFLKQCSHSGKCWQELPCTFDPQKSPWIDLNTCSAEELISTIDKCPSHALKYSLPEGSSVDPALAVGPGSIDYKIDPNAAIIIRVIKNGPLLVEGPTRIFAPNGELLKESDCLVLCRCGKTQNPPFCDGAHLKE
jgi:rubredoxin/uncharacterized Fe-S cluster protein YjdI